MARVAIVQLISGTSVADNLALLEPYFIQAQASGAKLLVLPENFAFMGANEKDKYDIAEQPNHGPIQDRVAELAARYALWVIAGTLPLKTQGTRLRAASLVYNDKGEQVARYDKIHLFDVVVSATESHQESLTIEPGNEVVVVDTPIGRVGLSVCYDLRFPELYRALERKGAQIFSIPAAFTAVTGLAHWELLLRSRAVENLAYVLAPNQGGLHENGRMTYGHSMLVEPWGEVRGIWPKGPGIVIGEIDLERVSKLRTQFPCNEHHILTD